MSKPIYREVQIPAEPRRIFQALLDAKTFAAITGAPSEIDAKAGGGFSCFDGIVTGRLVELIEDRTIVQAWRVKFWPEGDYSLVRFDLETQPDGARLSLEHKGFPEEMRAHLNGEAPEGGWDRQYLEPLRRHFGP